MGVTSVHYVQVFTVGGWLSQEAGGTLKTYIHSHFFSQPSSVPPPPMYLLNLVISHVLIGKIYYFGMFLWISEKQIDRNLLHTTTLRGFATSTTPGSQHDIFFDFLHAPTVKLNKQYKNQVRATTQQIMCHTQTV